MSPPTRTHFTLPPAGCSRGCSALGASLQVPSPSLSVASKCQLPFLACCSRGHSIAGLPRSLGLPCSPCWLLQGVPSVRLGFAWAKADVLSGAEEKGLFLLSAQPSFTGAVTSTAAAPAHQAFAASASALLAGQLLQGVAQFGSRQGRAGPVPCQKLAPAPKAWPLVLSALPRLQGPFPRQKNACPPNLAPAVEHRLARLQGPFSRPQNWHQKNLAPGVEHRLDSRGLFFGQNT